VRAAERENRGVLHGPALIDDESGCLRADVNERRAELLVVVRQGRLGGGELFQDHLADDESGAVDRVDDVLPRGDGACDDVDFDREARVIDSTAASGSTTTPLRKPRASDSPMPTMSTSPPSPGSPMMHVMRLVPMSRPTVCDACLAIRVSLLRKTWGFISSGA